jgi:hypothetical protein
VICDYNIYRTLSLNTNLRYTVDFFSKHGCTLNITGILSLRTVVPQIYIIADFSMLWLWFYNL